MTEADRQIAECIGAKSSFVLDAGAGAGKTTSLVAALRLAMKELGPEMARRGQHIACITFTNVAKDEIVERTAHSPLIRVSTIHDFLWSVLKGHQPALKRALLKFNANLKAESRRRKEPAALEAALPKVPVSYSDIGSNFVEGRIFHDDLLEVARLVFSDNPLLSRLVAAEYPYVLVDEYQDTHPVVIEILTERILAENPGHVTIGLFGDKMQSIYDAGVGELPPTSLARLRQIIKGENYRCSSAVIRVLNRLRTDVQQVAGGKNVEGDAVYVHVAAPTTSTLDDVRGLLAAKRGWHPEQGTQRELYLTHRLIARKSGYETLLAVFQARGDMTRDSLLTGEDTRIAFLLRRVEPVAEAWAARQQGLAVLHLSENDFTLTPAITKASTVEALDKLVTFRGSGDVAGVLRHVHDKGLARLPDDLRDRLAGKKPRIADTPEAKEREEKDAAFYSALFALPYSEIVAFAGFFGEHTPYSTKHGAKGAEFDSVLVVLDDKSARWNAYSFDKYLTGEDKGAKDERYRRTRNVFYVCCSRSRRDLAVVDLGAKTAAKTASVHGLFGADNCIWM